MQWHAGAWDVVSGKETVSGGKERACLGPSIATREMEW